MYSEADSVYYGCHTKATNALYQPNALELLNIEPGDTHIYHFKNLVYSLSLA